jgi:hypothetical protein
MILVCKAKSGTPRHRRKATIAPLSTAQTKILFQQELHEGSKAGGFIQPHRILSLVADATKVRCVCKPSESQASMALVINAIGAFAFPFTDKTRTTPVSSCQRRVFT